MTSTPWRSAWPKTSSVSGPTAIPIRRGTPTWPCWPSSCRASPVYSMEISRVIVKDSLVVVELTEVVEIGGAPLVTPEALVFELNDDGLIAHISIYIQTLPKTPPAV